MSPNVTSLVLNPVAACAARCRRMLDALARLGKRQMRKITFDPGAAAVIASVSAVTRIGRVIHLITLLELRLIALLAKGPAAPVPAAQAPREVERLHDRDDPERQDAPEPAERPERPERPERYEKPAAFSRKPDTDARTLTELVAAACHELGLGPEATLRAQAPFAALEALLAGKPPPPEPMRRFSALDRAHPRAPLPGASQPSDAKDARLETRSPSKPP